MQIDTNLLLAWGASVKKYKRNDVIFYEDNDAQFYYQIIAGKVKMININDDGKEFIQGLFDQGNSFGEPALFINEYYPATAVAVKDSTVIKLSRGVFLKLLEEYPKLQQKVIEVLARHVYNKAITAREIIYHRPDERILALLRDYKRKQKSAEQFIRMPFTRQEIANQVGLRVETVIRCLKKLETEGKVQIREHKLYF